MAILQGIAGMQMGDGAGGNVALSITTNVLRILSDQKLSYLTATMNNPTSVTNGTASYYVPELIGTTAYGDGTTGRVNPQSGLVSYNLDTRRVAKWTLETFDLTRLQEANYIVGMITSGLAMAIQADLNAQFLMFLKNQFEVGGALVAQTLTLDYIGTKQTTINPEAARNDLNLMEYQLADISTSYNKLALGVNKAEVMTLLSPYADIGIRNGFWGQLNLVNWAISPTLAGNQIGNVKYMVDNMLDKVIAANASFNEDYRFDMSKYVGFMLHNEAVAMPINIIETVQVIDQVNFNQVFGTKYQFGIGILRPWLIYALKRA